jgi:alginate O-acetyltransferase complex protein AlgI
MPAYTLLLLASVIVNYAFGTLIGRSSGGTRRLGLIVAVAANLCTLAYFKYANFLLQSVNYVASTHIPILDVILPLGISFFTFTQIAYLADVYAGKVQERNPIHYLLFVTYFPHLIAGPVLHHAEMMPQFRLPENYRPRLEPFAIGLTFLTIGLAKKILVADSIAPIANDAFDNRISQGIGVAHAWLGVSAYAFQLYFDFSGYSDMAVGLSLLVGVRLPYNFDSPYKARSIIDFWRRWHMTLSRFLRDYLYFALGGNRLGKLRRHLNLMVTMLLGGLWHGASWTFVVWGGLHGIYLVINHGWRYLLERLSAVRSASRPSWQSFLGQASSTLLTLVAVLIAWVFFRATSIDAALRLVSSMFVQPPHSSMSAADWHLLPWIVALSVVVLVAPNSQELIDGRVGTRLLAWRSMRRFHATLAFVVGVELVAIVLLAMIAARRSTAEFIYFNF